ncbi:Hypothetical predicted protein, partial [Olea europaea subsp. europaea]
AQNFGPTMEANFRPPQPPDFCAITISSSTPNIPTQTTAPNHSKIELIFLHKLPEISRKKVNFEDFEPPLLATTTPTSDHLPP